MSNNVWRRILMILLATCLAAGFFVFGRQTALRQAAIAEKRAAHLAEVRARYAAVVKVAQMAELYRLADGSYQKAGRLGRTDRLSLADADITPDTEYFPLAGLEGYFIDYRSVAPVDPAEPIPFRDERYKQLVPFDQDVTMRGKADLYRSDGSLAVELDQDLDLPLIVNEDDYYGVSYFDQLLWAKKGEASLIDHKNSDAPTAKAVRTLCYHKLYDANQTSCGSVICHELGQMRSHFDYLRQNGYYFMSMQDMLWWLGGKIRLPYNSVCLTFDDGGANTVLLVALLNEYQIHATLFLIGANYYPEMRSDYLELQSHTYDLHSRGECSIGRGSAAVCRPQSEVLADLTKSRELTGAIAFGYPYFQYSDELIETVKKAGFKLAFAGNTGLIEPGDDPYRLSRFECSSSTTVERLAAELH